MKMIKNLLSKSLAKVGAVVSMFVLGLTVLASNVHAAADTMLTGAVASSTSWFSDNLQALFDFVLTILFKFGAYALAIGAVTFIIYKLVRIFRSHR